MPYNSIVNIDISLDVTAVSQAGFGTIMFAGSHNYFPERTRSYTSLIEGAVDLPTASQEYQALKIAFSQKVKPSLVKIGRRWVDKVTIQVSGADGGDGIDYSFILTDKGGNPTVIEETTSITYNTNDLMAERLKDLATAVDGVTATRSADTITLTFADAQEYVAVIGKGALNYSSAGDATFETAPEMMAAITDYDDDFYFVTADDHTATFVEALSSDCEARTKQYWVSLADTTSHTANSDLLSGFDENNSTDVFSVFKNQGRDRSYPWYHDEADTVYPEVGYVATLATSTPGKKIAANNEVKGSDAARDINGRLLSSTYKGNLTDKNANFTEVVGGVTITRRGTASSNSTVIASLVRNRDFLQARITEAYQNLLINQPVIPATDSGIDTIENVLTSTLDRYVSTKTQPNILQEVGPYVVRFPTRAEMSFSDVANGIFRGEFEAYLAGAFRSIKITGSLTYQTQS